MEVVRRFKNHYFLYCYLLFLCIIGSCNLKNSHQDPEEREGVEDIDEDFDDDAGEISANTDTSEAKPSENDLTDSEIDEKNEINDDVSETDADIPDDDAGIVETFPDMTGTWANLTIFKGSAKVPLLGSTLPAWAVMVSKVDIYSQENGTLKAHTEMCRLKAGTATDLVYPYLPDSYAESLGNVDKTFYLSYGGNGEVRFRQDKLWEVRSCTLDDPENDPLPSDINDPRVFDADNSGMNGLYMGMVGKASGRAEIVQKVSTVLDGEFNENGEVYGITTWFEAQSVLWTDTFLLENGAPTSPTGADPNESVFIFKRIDSSWDCSDVKVKSAELFPEQAQLYPKEFQ